MGKLKEDQAINGRGFDLIADLTGERLNIPELTAKEKPDDLANLTRMLLATVCRKDQKYLQEVSKGMFADFTTHEMVTTLSTLQAILWDMMKGTNSAVVLDFLIDLECIVSECVWGRAMVQPVLKAVAVNFKHYLGAGHNPDKMRRPYAREAQKTTQEACGGRDTACPSDDVQGSEGSPE